MLNIEVQDHTVVKVHGTMSSLHSYRLPSTHPFACLTFIYLFEAWNTDSYYGIPLDVECAVHCEVNNVHWA